MSMTYSGRRGHSRNFGSGHGSQFDYDDEGYVNVWTDGACLSNGQFGARAGYGVYWGPDHELNACGPVFGRPTNNNAEIEAATVAMRQALDNGISKLAINTDSQFIINAVTKWMPGWKANGWRLYSGEPVRNQREFRALDKLQHQLHVKWVYVEAHCGHYGNEQADWLAKQGASDIGV